MPSVEVAPAACISWPNPPAITFQNERFIALHMMFVRIRPEAPTSEPEMIRPLFRSTNPAAHAARPEYEFKSETTTGMSAPPMGTVIRMPRTAATMMIRILAHCAAGLIAVATPSRITISTIARLVACCNGKFSGLPILMYFFQSMIVLPASSFLMLPSRSFLGSLPAQQTGIHWPRSLRNATTLPVNVTIPISRVSEIVMRESIAWSARFSTRQYSAIATTAEARPPEPLNRATISGMPVIGTFLAAYKPIKPPTTNPAMITPKLMPASLTSVTTIAINMPTAATMLPLRAVRGDESIFSPNTKKIAAIA